MKKLNILIITLFYLFLGTGSFEALADSWTRKADYPATTHINLPVAFSIGSKGYMGLGSFADTGLHSNDFWEYDPVSDTWTQKADFGGVGRLDAVSFSIGNKGYIGGGIHYIMDDGVPSPEHYKDFWEYDRVANSWMRKADFPATTYINFPVAFSIGSKGYMGLGSFADTGLHSNDFWEYDPVADTWTQKADFGGDLRYEAISLSIGNKGYIGGGRTRYQPSLSIITYMNDFWEYDPVANSWMRKADFPATTYRNLQVAFSIGNKGFIGLGSFADTGLHSNDFWEYDPVADTWTQKADFGGGLRSEAFSLSIGNKGYIGGGHVPYQPGLGMTYIKDFWEYDPFLDSTPHFEITGSDGNFIANQTPGTPFDITLTARNAHGSVKPDCSGNVYLSSSNGSLSPVIWPLTVGGITTVSVTIGAPGGQNIQIKATGCGISGASNPFNVGTSCTTGSIGGTVKQYKTKLSGATVNLAGPGGPYNATSDSNGVYNFPDIPSGTYTLWASHNGGESDRIPVSVSCAHVDEPLNVFTVCNANGKTPVLLVPGIMGSTLKKHPLKIIPTLHNKGWIDPSEMELYDGEATADGWEELRNALTSQGYVKGCTMFDVPYDWRMRSEEAATSYLRPAIIRAKQKAGSTKVNIIAHSMGGLVTRVYIQGASYQNDVDRFAMIGTPNHGSAMAYPMWDGGEPFTADMMAMKLPPVYTPTTIYLVKGPDMAKWARDYVKGQIEGGLCKSLTGGFSWLCAVKDAMFLYKDTAAYLIENAPSLWQLLPTDDFLNPYGKLSCQQNTWLAELNSSSSLARLTTAGDTDTAKVRTKIFMGNNIKTVSGIKVRLKWCSNPIYPDGIPQGFERTSSGDGTVLTASARLDSEATVSYGAARTEEHAKLVKAFASDAASFIDAGAAESSTLSMRQMAADAPVSSLSISTLGRVRPFVTSPTGQKSGIENNLSVNSIPNTSVSIGVDAGGITMDSPANGTYTITLLNSYAEDYELAISYVGTTGANSLLTARGFNHAGTTSFTFTLNDSATNKLILNHAPLPPINLLASAVDSGGLKTVLSWTKSPSQGITGYNIYAKFSDEPYLVLLGSTAATFFDTGDAWAESASIKARIYAVSAIGAGGKESFFSNTVENNDQDHDGLTDEEETALGTNASNPDSDGDGLKDGEESILGTNPLLADSDSDGYNDYREVIAGSDPLNPNSLPVVPHDVNGDRKSDILLRNTVTGRMDLWFMNANGAPLSTKTLFTALNSTIVGTGDFNGDGLCDLIKRDTDVGRTSIWFMNADGTRARYRTIFTEVNSTVIGTGDFNGDGVCDLIKRDSVTGQSVLWFMNADGTRASYKVLFTDVNSTVVGTGDFNGDGICDLIKRNSVSGQTVLWFMNADGTRASYKIILSMATWTVAGTADVNGDGVTDIIWRNTSTNQYNLWLMNADGTHASPVTLLALANWTLAGTGDINGDGLTDLIWRNTSGLTRIWFMNADGTHASPVTLFNDPNWIVLP